MGNTIAQNESAFYRSLRNKFCQSAILTVLMLAAMHLDSTHISEFIICTAIIAWPAFFLLQYGYESVKLREPDMFTLISLGIITAYLYSAFLLILRYVSPSAADAMGGANHLYFESAGMISCLVILGQMLEAKAFARTTSAIKSLLDLEPDTVTLIDENGQEKTVKAAEIKLNDRFIVRPGERIALDGKVISGSTHVDESMLSGESLPVARGTGSKVIGGTLNLEGAITVQAQAVGSDTVLARMIKLIETAQSSKSAAPVQKLVNKIAAVFVPLVIAIAVISFLVWYLAAGNFEFGFSSGIAVLLVACPCALGLATPMSITIGIGAAAAKGILVRNFEALERFRQIKYLILDKTGTLTENRPAVTGIFPAPGFTEQELLKYAAAAEKNSLHPLAKAVLQKYPDAPQAEDFREITGMGVKAVLDKTEIISGSLRFLESENIPLPAGMAQKPGSVIAVAAGGAYAGMLIISDPVRPGTKEVIDRFKAAGVTPVLLTGDNHDNAMAAADALGISEVYSNALPADKFAVIQKFQQSGSIVAMTGDGVNDAAALTMADVGIAMGGGSDAAIESASITLPGGDISKLYQAYALSMRISRNIRQNLFFAFIYNILAIPLAAGVFKPLGLTLPPEFGNLAMSISSVCVVFNALRLKRDK